MTSPRILMTADAVGGVWTYALELARALVPFGLRTTLVTMGPEPDADQQVDARAIDGLDLVCTPFTLEWMDDAWDDPEAAFEWLLALERRIQPSIVHLNGFTQGHLPWRAPAVVVGHSCVLSWKEASGGEFDAQWLDRYRAAVAGGIQGADCVLAPSATMLAALQRLYGPVPSASVIYNGRDPERFCPADKQPLIVAAGRRWDRAKNIDALHAIESQLSWPLVVAGDTSIGRGRLSQADVAVLLARASIVAAPARYEPFGLLPLEGALSGCALVLGDIPSLREIWRGAAVFVDPDSPEALRNAIEALIADPGRMQALGTAARQRARRLTPAAMARGYMLIYRALTGWEIDRGRLACAS